MSDDPARKRFFAIQAIRMCGVAMVVVGLLVAGGKIALPYPVGIGLIVVGLFDAFVMPVVLARKWRTPR